MTSNQREKTWGVVLVLIVAFMGAIVAGGCCCCPDDRPWSDERVVQRRIDGRDRVIRLFIQDRIPFEWCEYEESDLPPIDTTLFPGRIPHPDAVEIQAQARARVQQWIDDGTIKSEVTK